ncbi:MAG: hypothetical protein N2Z21_07185 [Candidatus Sumerlaeaceae bacterium]|nr:hypothetical protein [Candidatus Sumerlaeaceae bacterium]
MNDPYVAANIPIIRELAAMLDWALVAHVFLAGVIVFLAWRVAHQRARIRDLEDILAQLEQKSQKVNTLAVNELGPLADDRQIPPVRFASDSNGESR